MPVLSRFYGIIIKMYFQQSEHNPPHVHVVYSGYAAEFSIRSGRLLDGKMPQKETALIRSWIRIHKDELLEIWGTQQFKRITPLK